MVGPWVVSYPAIDSFIGVARSFSAELPNGPVIAMFCVEEGDQAVEWVAVGSLGICLTGTGSVQPTKLAKAAPQQMGVVQGENANVTIMLSVT